MKANIKDKGKWGIYCIKNTVNQKVYVGKAIDIHRRIKQHITQLNTKSKDENIYLINAWHKHSRTAFEYSVLEYIEVDDYSEKGITKYLLNENYFEYKNVKHWIEIMDITYV